MQTLMHDSDDELTELWLLKGNAPLWSQETDEFILRSLEKKHFENPILLSRSWMALLEDFLSPSLLYMSMKINEKFIPAQTVTITVNIYNQNHHGKCMVCENSKHSVFQL